MGVTLGGLFQYAAESLAGAREARHHRTDRDTGDPRDLPIREVVDLTQHQHLPELGRQRLERGREIAALRLADRARVRRVSTAAVGAVHVVVVRDVLRPALSAAPAVAAVANDGEQPGTLVPAAKPREIAPRPKIRLLHDVLR